MTLRQDASISINIPNIEQFNNKVDIRNYLLNQWIIERPQTKYRYFVETLSNGNRIYLERPGRLNKGCDFVIFIENHIFFNNGNDKPPKHDFILEDIKYKKANLTNQEFNNLINSITDIYNCLPINTALNYIINQRQTGENYELILKTLRWLFIEQDITYWAKSGRQMLYNGIMEI
ncbi:MAG: hypothetical protein COS42_10145 [Flavobacteriales bacterium CG03_land_8_20_14_0_80_35_15]|nr:MAG: hypothetical protein COS42_10145 [Flavobacteriales bacterium CG03_land_8_20_14_0_80_35_15]PJA05911.1 MAG: hypothetical protein COX71_04275 [Flavobacteriales bacterium CG_4_10_14_0_2_um_filter_35_18]